MGTTAKENYYASARKGDRRENCVNGGSSFPAIDLCQLVTPDVEKAPHPSKIPFVEERTDQPTNSGGTGSGAFPSVLLSEPTPGDTLGNGLPSDPPESSAPATEQSLIDRIRSGQRELFMDLVRPHQRTVYGTVFSLLSNKEDAEDVTQDAFVKALARLHQFRSESSFGTWLIQIAINETRMRNRKQWRVPIMSLTRDRRNKETCLPKDFEDWRDIPSTALERLEVRKALGNALGSLAQHYREAFVLRDIHELSISQTSGILGISPGAVKSRLRRARLMLRDLLAPGLGQDGRLGWASKGVKRPWE
jgi:RNA polymerase sigma-70 factor (ECF subfamily)